MTEPRDHDPIALADRLDRHPPAWAEDAHLLERAAAVIRSQADVIARLRSIVRQQSALLGRLDAKETAR